MTFVCDGHIVTSVCDGHIVTIVSDRHIVTFVCDGHIVTVVCERHIMTFVHDGHIVTISPQWGTADAELKSHLVRTQSLNAVSIELYLLRLLSGISSLLISTLPVHLSAFFPKPLPISPVLAVAYTWFLCRPAE